MKNLKIPCSFPIKDGKINTRIQRNKVKRQTPDARREIPHLSPRPTLCVHLLSHGGKYLSPYYKSQSAADRSFVASP